MLTANRRRSVVRPFCDHASPQPSVLQRRGDRRLIETLATDHHQATGARLADTPGAVEIMLQAAADALDDLPQLLSGHDEKAFEAQDVMRGDRRPDPVEEAGSIGNRAALHDEALEIVVIVRLAGRVMRGAVRQ